MSRQVLNNTKLTIDVLSKLNSLQKCFPYLRCHPEWLHMKYSEQTIQARQESGTYLRRAGTIVLSLLTANLAKASLLSNPIRLLSSITKPDDVVEGAFNYADILNELAIRKHFTECKLRQHTPVVLSET